MKKYALVMILLFSAGCLGDADTNGDGKVDAQEVAKAAADMAPVVDAAANASEPAINEIERATGPVLTEKQKARGQAIANGAEAVLKTGGGIATAIPGGQTAALILTTLGTLAGTIGTVLSRRQTKKVAVAAVNAADTNPGGGKALVSAATDAGVGDLIAAVHSRK
jgi:hypothetical protein